MASARTRWTGCSAGATAVEADLSEALLLDDMATSPFVMNEELNFRIALW
jgi:hypothetical protein